MTEMVQLSIGEAERRRKISEALIGIKRSEETRRKMSKAKRREKNPFYGKSLSEEHKRKISEANRGREFSEEHRRKLSEVGRGTNHPNYGKRLPEEHRQRISEANRGREFSEEHRRKLSEVGRGTNHPNWKGGISFEPYCPRFNNQLKERIRNRDNRTCVLCGTGEIQNGQRLSVHHIDGDKMQGCVGHGWYLCALCISCNSQPDTAEKEFLIITNTLSYNSKVA